MKGTLFAVGFAAIWGWAAPTHAGTLKCPADSVKVGNVCIDKYEASVWQIAPSNTGLVKLVQRGKATLADLTGGRATQLAPAGTCADPSDYGTKFPSDGNWTPVLGSDPPSPGAYAGSLPGVQPSACITWFQANQACLLSGKRLLTNREWQGAAAGTPDPGNTPGPNDCNTNSGGPSNTGSRRNCKSSWGVFDMIGNVTEWVADWADRFTARCTDWTAAAGLPGGDLSCFGGDGSLGGLPGALLRGGPWDSGVNAGVFAVSAAGDPSLSFDDIGFRCAR